MLFNVLFVYNRFVRPSFTSLCRAAKNEEIVGEGHPKIYMGQDVWGKHPNGYDDHAHGSR